MTRHSISPDGRTKAEEERVGGVHARSKHPPRREWAARAEGARNGMEKKRIERRPVSGTRPALFGLPA